MGLNWGQPLGIAVFLIIMVLKRYLFKHIRK